MSISQLATVPTSAPSPDGEALERLAAAIVAPASEALRPRGLDQLRAEVLSGLSRVVARAEAHVGLCIELAALQGELNRHLIEATCCRGSLVCPEYRAMEDREARLLDRATRGL